MVERSAVNRLVVGSNPTSGAILGREKEILNARVDSKSGTVPWASRLSKRHNCSNLRRRHPYELRHGTQRPSDSALGHLFSRASRADTNGPGMSPAHQSLITNHQSLLRVTLARTF